MNAEFENGAQHNLEDRNIPQNHENENIKSLETNVVDEQVDLDDNELLLINTEQFKGDTLFVSGEQNFCCQFQFFTY